MTEIERAIQEFEDMTYHPSLKKRISDASCLEALNALHQAADIARGGICAVCVHNPPSSGDGKPCCMCGAVSGEMEGER